MRRKTTGTSLWEVSSPAPSWVSEVCCPRSDRSIDQTLVLTGPQLAHSPPSWATASLWPPPRALSNTPVDRCSATRRTPISTSLSVGNSSGRHTESPQSRLLPNWARDEVRLSSVGGRWPSAGREPTRLLTRLHRYLWPRIRRETGGENQGGIRYRGSHNGSGIMNMVLLDISPAQSLNSQSRCVKLLLHLFLFLSMPFS